MKRKFNTIAILFILVLFISIFVLCNSESTDSLDNNDNLDETNSCIRKANGEEVLDCIVKIVREMSHKGDRRFTQGFEIYNGYLYESTGQYDGTALKKLDIRTGQIVRQQFIEEYFSEDEIFFGEGITMWDDQIIQLSWKKGEAYFYDLSFNKLDKEFSYQTEGWGLTHDDKYLIMSDGSPYIYFRNPETFEIVNRKHVGVVNLNELEYVDGKIFANVWKEKYILMIDAESGDVLAKIDGSALLCANLSNKDSNAVLNGIAYDLVAKTFYITGKNCPLIYEVTFESVE